MDDFVISNLHESRNEWCSRLVSIFCPLIIEGVRSIFNESWKLCLENDEANKYLMTFQNLLSRIPKWNNQIIEDERKRIIERSGCSYLEDLITCVHIIQLKILTCIRVGNRQKKIDISIPKLDSFIHKVYINVARKVYSNVYLFEKNVSSLQFQKNNRELEMLVQECIMISIRESIPTEEIIRSYMDESVEQEEEVTVETIEEPVKPTEENISQNGGDLPEVPINESAIQSEEDAPYITPTIKDINDEPVITRLTSNNTEDYTGGTNNSYSQMDDPVSAPSKTLERLEQMTTANAFKRKLDEIEESGDISSDKIKIFTDPIDLSGFEELDEKKGKVTDDFLLEDVEELF
jgi:hypothetical protein